MSKALKEIKHFDEYDYVWVNDNLENTFQKLSKLKAERLKLPKQLYLSDFVKAKFNLISQSKLNLQNSSKVNFLVLYLGLHLLNLKMNHLLLNCSKHFSFF